VVEITQINIQHNIAHSLTYNIYSTSHHSQISDGSISVSSIDTMSVFFNMNDIGDKKYRQYFSTGTFILCPMYIFLRL